MYPNPHYQAVGKQIAEQDIEQCMQLASGANLEGSKGGEVAKQAAGGAAVGGAAGGAYGLVTGDAGQRAAGGAAAGAAAGAVRGAMRSGDPDPLYRRFVEKCLRDRGYEVIGWR